MRRDGWRAEQLGRCGLPGRWASGWTDTRPPGGGARGSLLRPGAELGLVRPPRNQHFSPRPRSGRPRPGGAACALVPGLLRKRGLLTHQLVAAGQATARNACPVCRALCAHRARLEAQQQHRGEGPCAPGRGQGGRAPPNISRLLRALALPGRFSAPARWLFQLDFVTHHGSF